MLRRTWRPVLGAIACASAIGEVVSAFFVEAPAAALVLAGLFLAAWLWLRRGGVSPIVLIGILCAMEALGFLVYEREGTADWVLQVVLLSLAAVGVVATLGALRDRRPL